MRYSVTDAAPFHRRESFPVRPLDYIEGSGPCLVLVRDGVTLDPPEIAPVSDSRWDTRKFYNNRLKKPPKPIN